jgi:hypothetical protein
VWNAGRWDYWDRAIAFEIDASDRFRTGTAFPACTTAIVIQQEWLAGE